jgi:asparagine N-glycosylation enzyme membrane subunit Stt3
MMHVFWMNLAEVVLSFLAIFGFIWGMKRWERRK